jgi:hypothetical protein
VTPAPRALARTLVTAARTIDRRIGRALGSPAVLVEARTPMNLAVLQPVFTPLLHDARLKIFFTGSDRADLHAAFASAGVLDRVIARPAAKWMRFDLYMNADPWEAVRLRRVARRLNFFHGVAGKYDLDCPSSLPLGLARYDRIAFPNEARLEAYVRAGIATASQAALVGYPKADILANYRRDASEAARVLGLDPSRRTVIFAPTFSTASALHEAGEAITETLLASGLNVIVKLHDRSLDPDPRFNGGVNWRDRFRRYLPERRFRLADGGDSTPYVLASDLMVSDHSSIAFEFLLLDRPLIVFEAPSLVSTARINPEKVALLRSAALLARDSSTLSAAVQASLRDPSHLSDARRHVTSQVFYRAGTATERALRVVYELLELDAAFAAAGAPSVRAWSTE